MKMITFDQFLEERFTPKQREQIARNANELVVEILLQQLSQQKASAGRKPIDADQLEAARNHETSLKTLSYYTSALGGELSVVVKFPKRKAKVVVVPGTQAPDSKPKRPVGRVASKRIVGKSKQRPSPVV